MIANDEEDAAASRAPPAALTDLTASQQPPSAPVSPQVVGHLSVDLEYYRGKSEKLASENDDQRRRLLSMEEKMRAMEERMESQERSLRHAAVDMNASR